MCVRIPSVIFVITLLGLSAVSAEVWVRGSAVALSASGAVRIEVPANGQSYESFDSPQYFPGIFNCRAEQAGSVFILLSSQLRLAFRGEGFFSVERAESFFDTLPGPEASPEASRERITLNLRRGELIIDSRGLSDAAKLILETPFGRISAVRGVVLLQVEFDRRSGIYDFTISSAEGMARLFDLRGQAYDVYPGQRLSGAGSYLTPAIEVGEQMTEIREKLQAYFAMQDVMDPAQVDPMQLQAHLAVIPGPEQSDGPIGSRTEPSKSSARRPRVIEFAPAAEPFSPFRAEVKPPSDFQADLF